MPKQKLNSIKVENLFSDTTPALQRILEVIKSIPEDEVITSAELMAAAKTSHDTLHRATYVLSGNCTVVRARKYWGCETAIKSIKASHES